MRDSYLALAQHSMAQLTQAVICGHGCTGLTAMPVVSAINAGLRMPPSIFRFPLVASTLVWIVQIIHQYMAIATISHTAFGGIA
jgi:hypothetical protein